MTLGNLGAGQIAQAFAIHLLKAGHEVLLSNGRGPDILDAPAEYPYSPGYFAVYSADPDGLKFEFAHAPWI